MPKYVKSGLSYVEVGAGAGGAGVGTQESIGADGAFSTPVLLQEGNFDWTLQGTWAGRVSLQRSKTLISPTWATFKQYTANIDTWGTSGSDMYYRWGFVSGDYVSGTALGGYSQ